MLHGVIHARLLHAYRTHLARDRFRPIQRGTVRQLRNGDDVFLVLRGHEPTRHNASHHHRGSKQHHIENEHAALVRNDPCYAVTVPFRRTMKYAIEHAEESTESTIHYAGKPVLGFVVALEKQGGQGW